MGRLGRMTVMGVGFAIAMWFLLQQPAFEAVTGDPPPSALTVVESETVTRPGTRGVDGAGGAVQLTEEGARQLFDEALGLYEQERFMEAESRFVQLRKAPAVRQDGLYYAAMCHLRQAEVPARALALFRGYVAEYGEDARSLLGMGLAYGLMGQFERQVAACRRVLESEPDNAKAHYQLAQAYDKLDISPKAVQHARRAMALDERYQEELQPFLAQSRASERIGSILTEVMERSEETNLSEEQIKAYAQRLREVTGDGGPR